MKSFETELITSVLCPLVIPPTNGRQLLVFLHDSDLFGQICRDSCSVLVNYCIFIFLMFYLHGSNFLIGFDNHYTYQNTLKKILHAFEARKEKSFPISYWQTELT